MPPLNDRKRTELQLYDSYGYAVTPAPHPPPPKKLSRTGPEFFAGLIVDVWKLILIASGSIKTLTAWRQTCKRAFKIGGDDKLLIAVLARINIRSRYVIARKLFVDNGYFNGKRKVSRPVERKRRILMEADPCVGSLLFFDCIEHLSYLERLFPNVFYQPMYDYFDDKYTTTPLGAIYHYYHSQEGNRDRIVQSVCKRPNVFYDFSEQRVDIPFTHSLVKSYSARSSQSDEFLVDLEKAIGGGANPSLIDHRRRTSFVIALKWQLCPRSAMALVQFCNTKENWLRKTTPANIPNHYEENGWNIMHYVCHYRWMTDVIDQVVQMLEENNVNVKELLVSPDANGMIPLFQHWLNDEATSLDKLLEVYSRFGITGNTDPTQSPWIWIFYFQHKYIGDSGMTKLREYIIIKRPDLHERFGVTQYRHVDFNDGSSSPRCNFLEYITHFVWCSGSAQHLDVFDALVIQHPTMVNVNVLNKLLKKHQNGRYSDFDKQERLRPVITMLKHASFSLNSKQLKQLGEYLGQTAK